MLITYFCFFDHQDGKNPISSIQSIPSNRENTRKRQKMETDCQLEIISEVQADTESKQKESPSVAHRKKRVSWKQLVGEAKDTTFSVSQLLPSVDSIEPVCSEPRDMSKKPKKLFIQMDDEDHSSMSSEVSDALGSAEEIDRLSDMETSSKDNSITEQSENESDNEVAEKCNGTFKTSALEELPSIVVKERSSDIIPQEPQNKLTSSIDQHQSNENSTSNQFGRGTSWLQKSSWMQLVGGGSASTFSISQLVPDIDKLKPTSPKPYNVDAYSKERKVTPHSNFHSSSDRSKRNKAIHAEKTDGNSDSKKTSKMASDVSDDKSQSVPEELGENGNDKACLFMRNADSVKQWTKIRAALRGKAMKRVQMGSAKGSKEWSKKR